MDNSETILKLLQNYKINPTGLVVNATEKSLLLTIKIEDLNKNFQVMLSDFIYLIPLNSK